MISVAKMMREVAHRIDYWHIRWGLRERLKPSNPDFLRASRRLYEYQRSYGWK